MRLIRNNRLYESILDNIGGEITPSSSNVLSNNISGLTNGCDATIFFMLLFHTRDQIFKLHNLIERVADGFYDSVDQFRGVTEFATEVMITNPDYPDNKTTYPHILLKKDNAEDTVLLWSVNENNDLHELTDTLEKYSANIPKKGNIPVEFRLCMNLTKNFTMKTAAILTGQLFKVMRQMVDIVCDTLSNSISYMMMFNDEYYVVHNYKKDYDSSYRKCFMQLMRLHTEDEAVLRDALEYIRAHTSKRKQKLLSGMQMPEEFSKLFTEKDLRYIAGFRPKIEIQSNKITATIPEYVSMHIVAVYYLWYYVFEKYNKVNNVDMTLEVYINGTLVVENDICERTNEYIQFAKQILSKSTEFRKLNFKLLQDVYAEKLILFNPVLQRTKADAQEQSCDIDRDRWKNPDIVIESPTHDIIIEDVPRFPGKEIIKAIKK